MTDERKKTFFVPICLGFLNHFSPLACFGYLSSSPLLIYIITVESERTERERERERERDVSVVRILIIY